MSETGRAINTSLWRKSDPLLFCSHFQLAFKITENVDVLRIRTKLSVFDMTFVY